MHSLSLRPLGMVLALALAACVATPLHAAADTAAALPAIEAFFAKPALGRPALSPSARYLAAISGKEDRRDCLIVIDLQTNAATVVAGYKDVDIAQFQWVNDQRLVFNVVDKNAPVGNRNKAAGLYAVDRDGGNMRQLASRTEWGKTSPVGSHIGSKILPWYTFMLDEPGAQNSNAIHVTSYVWEDMEKGILRARDLLKLDTVSGTVEKVERPGDVMHWMLDHQGEPRLAIGYGKGITTIHYRDRTSATWRVLASFDTYKGGEDNFQPIGFGTDGVLYATAIGEGDTTALYKIDLATGKRSKNAVVATPGYDFTGNLVMNGAKLLGVRVHTDAAGTVWFDPAMTAAQHKLDALLPGTVNLMSFPSGTQSERALVQVLSDVQPSSYMLFNLKTGELNPVGTTYPGIESTRMGRQDPIRYKTRDGLEIPALLTLPANGEKNAPLVVLAHDGPFQRGVYWGWKRERQFLASRGYAVLEPEFRGSQGYGLQHFRAGWKQWGLAMQNDLADGARWAIAQGIADPKRICIAGGGYGGYAALMGLVNDVDLYKCGISWGGITDLGLLYDGHWRSAFDLGEQWKRHGVLDLIGDRDKDAAQLKATSPIEQAARIKAPLLMAHGGVDGLVPIYHGQKFVKAIKPFNTQVEWIEYPDEGHDWRVPANRVDFWSRVEKFLDKHIGGGAQGK